MLASNIKESCRKKGARGNLSDTLDKGKGETNLVLAEQSDIYFFLTLGEKTEGQKMKGRVKNQANTC